MLAPRTTPRRGRRGAVGESAYRARTVRGAQYFTSRQEHQDLTVVVQRFPIRSPETGVTFVLVHGLGVSSRYFHPLAAELALQGRVFLVDLPGYGAAPNPKRDVGIADHAAVVAAMVVELGIENPVLVGHSMGSEVVARVLLDHPHVTDRAVLMAPTLPPSERTAFRAIRNLLHDALREPPEVFGIAFTDYLIRCGPPYLFAQLPHMLRDRIEDALPSIEARVLVVNGDRDTIVPNSWAASLAALAPVGRFVEVHGPHVIMHTDPVMIAGHIADFLAER